MKIKKRHISEKWNKIRQTSGFRNSMLFLIFVIISTLFWFILALNDSAQNSITVGINITNKPDSVTFISDIPDRIHVNVRDKGTSLWRSAMKKPVLNINFRDYASNGEVKMTNSDIVSGVKNLFGPSSQIISISIDSLKLIYTTNKGRQVPVIVNYNVFPSSGNVMEASPETSPKFVEIYGESSIIDTVNYVFTDFIELKDLSETTSIKVNIKKIKNTRILPSQIEVTFPIEPLVMKEAMVTISPINVPENESLLLFPSKVPVKYFVAMTRLNDDEDKNIELVVDYNELLINKSGKLHIKLEHYPARLKNLQLETDSVEYAILKQ